ncbi:MAG: GFA family protein [Kiloniellales bacterium]
MAITGGCLCGEVRYRATGEAFWVAHCHCRWCQRASGAAFLTYVGFRTEDLEWVKGVPTIYKSSVQVERGFCARCGGTLSFARPSRAEIGVCAGTLDNPQDLAPEAHIFTDHQLAWLHLDDGLPRHGRFPPGAEDREPE